MDTRACTQITHTLAHMHIIMHVHIIGFVTVAYTHTRLPVKNIIFVVAMHEIFLNN